jgi:hypothetical protein
MEAGMQFLFKARLIATSTDQRAVDVEVAVSEPIPSGTQDYYCVVKVHPLVGGTHRIFGIDAAQAVALSFDFIEQVSQGAVSLTTKTGDELDFARIKKDILDAFGP